MVFAIVDTYMHLLNFNSGAQNQFHVYREYIIYEETTERTNFEARYL